MSNSLPCPNPTCSHLFSSTDLVSDLTCPSCGTVFRFQVGPASMASYPVATPAEPPRMGIPVPSRTRKVKEPLVPMMPELGELAANNALVQAPPRPTQRRSGSRVLRWASLVLLVAGIIAAHVAIRNHGLELVKAWFYPEDEQEAEKPVIPQVGASFSSKSYDYRFIFPSKDWSKAEELRDLIHNNSLLMKRSDPPAWFSMAVFDYKTFTPDIGRIHEEGIRQLSGYFKDLKWEESKQTELSGQKSQRLVFQGKVAGVSMRGECTMLAYHGIGYWLITWAGVEDSKRLEEEFASVRRGFAFTNLRADWKEKPVLQSFVGDSVPYEMRDVPGPWVRSSEPESQDPAADLLLVGNDPDQPRGTEGATILVRSMRKQGEPATFLAQASTRYKKLHPKATTEVLAGKFDIKASTGGLPWQITKMHVTHPDKRERLLLLAVASREDLDEVLILQCSCDWNRKIRWAPLFQEVLANLRYPAKPGEPENKIP